MSLKDRLRSKKETKAAVKAAQNAESCEFKISIKKVTEAASKIKNPADLGNIVKEFSKFLNTLVSEDAKITFSGSFDLGQKTLLNCILANFIEDGKTVIKSAAEETEEDEEEIKAESKLIKRRKAVKARVAQALKDAE